MHKVAHRHEGRVGWRTFSRCIGTASPRLNYNLTFKLEQALVSLERNSLWWLSMVRTRWDLTGVFFLIVSSDFPGPLFSPLVSARSENWFSDLLIITGSAVRVVTADPSVEERELNSFFHPRKRPWKKPLPCYPLDSVGTGRSTHRRASRCSA